MVVAAFVLTAASVLLVPPATASAGTTPALSAVDITPAIDCPNSIAVEVLFSAPLSASETVQLTSSNAAVKVPATATFQALGLGGGVSGITVSDVTAKTPVTITATLDGAKVSASYTLLPSWSSGNGKITLSQEFPGPYYSPAVGNEIFVNLSDPVASGDTLSVSATTTNSSAVSDLLTPAIITSGCEQGVISFDAPGQTSAVHATVTVSVDGVTSSIPVTIEPYLKSFTLPTSMEGGASATGTINMAGPVDTATTVNLNSTWDGILSVPGTVTIPAGSASATFPITTERNSENETVGIAAILGVNANSANFESQGIEVLTWGTLPAPPRGIPPVGPAPASPVR